MTLNEDLVNGKWLISSYGNYLALGFQGTPDFIRRCYNWAVNTGVVHKGQRLNWYHERVTGKLAYICPKSREAIERGLGLQFRAEIVAAREIPPLRDEWEEVEDEETPSIYHFELDEEKIDQLAQERASSFMQNLITDDFVLARVNSIGEIYSIAPLAPRSSEE